MKPTTPIRDRVRRLLVRSKVAEKQRALVLATIIARPRSKGGIGAPPPPSGDRRGGRP